MTRARIATPWPEQPVDYVRRPMDSLSMARATRDRQMLEAVQRQIRLQDMRDNLPRYVAPEQLRARVWIAIFISFGIVAAVLISLVAHMEAVTHPVEAVRG
jgi:hypothetical protein